MRIATRPFRPLLALAGVLAALLVTPAGAAAPPPTAVVGVIDTGINPYHAAFRDRSPQAQKHPSTYLPGYPKNAVALRITLDAKDYWTAVLADCERVWKTVQPGQLYWFPGTKIVGAVSFMPSRALNCNTHQPVGLILDSNGHGTMTASRAAGTGYGACPACRVVAVQFSASALEATEAVNSVKWTTANAGWIDAQSNSWMPFLPGWVPTDAGDQLFVATPPLVRAVEASGQAHLSFWASGNGAGYRAGGLGHPTPIAPTLTPSVLAVGGHDSGQVNTWPGFPAHVVSDSCSSWAAAVRSTTEWGDTIGGGTSAATPFAAGGAGVILTEARRLLRDSRTGVRNGVVASGRKGLVKSGPLADGSFTVAEWREVLLKTATPRPTRQREDGPPCGVGPYGPTPVQWSSVPPDYPEYLHIGYGAVDRPALALATSVLRGSTPLPNRADTDQYFGYDRQVREAAYRVWSAGP